MARLSTCVVCAKQLTKDEKYKYSGKTHCKECYEAKVNEHNEYKHLLEYISTLFQIDIPTPTLMKQVRDLHDKYDFTYPGIEYCLWYCKYIKGMNMDIKYGIGIVYYEYKNAESYYERQNKIADSVKKAQLKDSVKKIGFPKINKKNTNLLFNIDNFLMQ